MDTYNYYKTILTKVSFSESLFCKEVEKALKSLLPKEREMLERWVMNYVSDKPELRVCVLPIVVGN